VAIIWQFTQRSFVFIFVAIILGNSLSALLPSFLWQLFGQFTQRSFVFISVAIIGQFTQRSFAFIFVAII
jgi:uncharacterized membrane protein YwzB